MIDHISLYIEANFIEQHIYMHTHNIHRAGRGREKVRERESTNVKTGLK